MIKQKVIDLPQTVSQKNITIRDTVQITTKAQRNYQVDTYESEPESTDDKLELGNENTEELLNYTLKIMEFSNHPLPKKKE